MDAHVYAKTKIVFAVQTKRPVQILTAPIVAIAMKTSAHAKMRSALNVVAVKILTNAQNVDANVSLALVTRMSVINVDAVKSLKHLRVNRPRRRRWDAE
jgi:hypothetical protein